MLQVQNAGAAAVDPDLHAHGEPAVASPVHPHREVCCFQGEAPVKHASAVSTQGAPARQAALDQARQRGLHGDNCEMVLELQCSESCLQGTVLAPTS